jgi:hypothetical protein
LEKYSIDELRMTIDELRIELTGRWRIRVCYNFARYEKRGTDA